MPCAVDVSEFGRLCRAFRRSCGMGQASILRRLDGCPDAWKVLLSSRHRLDAFESGGITSVCDDLESLVDFAGRVYGVPRLMVVSLASAAMKGPFIKERLPFSSLASFGMAQPTKTATYSIPASRLVKSDAVFAYVQIQAGGVSDTHRHPGDELLLVIRGRVEVALERAGLRVGLSEGEYVHFDSLQEHSVTAIGCEPSEVFVIRFHQLQSRGAAQVLGDVMEEFVAEIRQSGGSTDLSSRRWLAFRQLVLPYLLRIAGVGDVITDDTLEDIASDSSRPIKPIRDPIGFAKLLREFIGLRKQSILALTKEFNGQCEKRGIQRNRHQIRDFTIGYPVPNSGRRDIEILAKVLGVPEVLFLPCLAAAVPEVVVVTSKDYSCESKKEGVEYSIPNRTLANSDVSINRVRLSPGIATDWNQHPGLEMVLCQDGNMTVEFQSSQATCTVNPQEMCHYESDMTHRVANWGTIDASAVVVRFYRYDSSFAVSDG